MEDRLARGGKVDRRSRVIDSLFSVVASVASGCVWRRRHGMMCFNRSEIKLNISNPIMKDSMKGHTKPRSCVIGVGVMPTLCYERTSYHCKTY